MPFAPTQRPFKLHSLHPLQRVALVTFVLLLLAFAGRELYLASIAGNWTILEPALVSEEISEVQDAFANYQAETHEEGLRLAQSDELHDLLAADSIISLQIFELLLKEGRKDVTIEIFDGGRRLIAWAGDRGVLSDLAHIPENQTSYILEGPIYSYLVVASPIEAAGRRLGFVVVKRLFEVNYPINNRFVNASGFTSTFRSKYPDLPYFSVTNDDSSRVASSQIAFPLRGIARDTIATAIADRLDAGTYQERIRNAVNGWIGLLILFILVTLAVDLLRTMSMPSSSPIRLFVTSSLIWGCRYLLIWIDFPSAYFDSVIFEPSGFASPFGWGLAKSTGDLFLTSLFLAGNFGMIIPALLRFFGQPHRQRKGWLYLLVPLFAGMLVVLLRSLAAITRSAVFDSTLPYNDPSSLLPTLEMGVMLASLLLLGSAILAGGAILSYAIYLVLQSVRTGVRPGQAWVVAGLIVVVACALAGLMLPNPLMKIGEWIGVGVVSVVAGYWLGRFVERGISILRPELSMILAACGVLLIVPLLDRNAHELDRSHLEVMTAEIIRPTDTWLTFLVNQALDELAGAQVAMALTSGNHQDVERLAFTQWARSILGREGNNCSVTYINREGSVVSDFHIGLAHHWYREHHMDEMPRSSRLVTAEDRSTDGNVFRWYKGYTPVFGPDSVFVGGVWITLASGKQRLMDESPVVLRNSAREDFDEHFRKLVYSEYFQGKLTSSTSDRIPTDRQLPAAVASSSANHLWIVETIDGEEYESFYLRDRQDPTGQTWVSLGMESLGLQWHVYSYLRYVLFFFLLASIGLCLYLVAQLARGKRIFLNFRRRLFAAFVIVSLIPVAIVAYYNRQYANERAYEAIVNQLADQSAVIVNEIQRQLGISVPFELTQLTDEHCEEIATDLNADFNVYRGDQIQASSKPEMFAAELLDPHLSAGAYANIVLQKRGFFAESQSIGTLPYIVGYRPVISQKGTIIGTVAVPTLYRRLDIEEELTRRNVFLYGAYALALGFSLLVGSIFANQISHPVRRLKSATEQVAAGNLEVQVARSGRDELGDLERAFGEMTERLRHSQEEMARAERELAWREMAKQVAHEIKNPLTPIKLSMQHLMRAYKDKAPDLDQIIERVASTVAEQIEALTRIASEFSTFARMPERNVQTHDLHEILREAGNLFQSENLVINYHLGARPSLVRADREELRRAFINILRNSVQAMMGTGRIEIQTHNAGGTLETTVADNGPGMSNEVLNRLFEPNFSTKTDGMGLGLTIVRAIISDLNGEITVSSSPGGGTTVTVRIPGES